uniref:ProQ/FinO domain-containing protein n=1 Tax=mine drainage metagenome TaxID=410659 RepID=E6Q9Z2_9ZZZZ
MTDAIAEIPGIVNFTDTAEPPHSEKKAFRRLIKTEVMLFPVFTQGEILPLKYKIRDDMREVLCRTHGKDKKAVINAVIDKLLKDYCSQVKRPDYALAAVMKQQRYDLHGKAVKKISQKDMTAFVAALRYHERLQREALQRKEEKERKRLAHEQRLQEREQAKRAKRTAKRKRQRAAKVAQAVTITPTVGNGDGLKHHEVAP